MAKTKPDRVCRDCIYFHACQMWTSGILDDTDARPCRNYETVDNCDAYYLGTLDGRQAKDWISVNDMTPEYNQEVLVLRYNGGVYFADFGKWNGTEWTIEDYEAPLGGDIVVDDVMFWVPIPDPPGDDTDG